MDCTVGRGSEIVERFGPVEEGKFMMTQVQAKAC